MSVQLRKASVRPSSIGYRSPSRPSKGLALLILPVLLALLALGFFVLNSSKDDSTDEAGPVVSFDLTSLDGGTGGPGDFPGKVVVVDFWATWCAPCRVQADVLEVLHEEFEGEVGFLAVSVGEDLETVASYAKDTPFPYPVLIDPEDKVSGELGIYALPTVMILDREGRVAYVQSGVSNAATLRDQLSKLG